MRFIGGKLLLVLRAIIAHPKNLRALYATRLWKSKAYANRPESFPTDNSSNRYNLERPPNPGTYLAPAILASGVEFLLAAAEFPGGPS
jgi:hypothetical protein